MGPRKKYQSKSRSRRAYSARSRVEEAGGVRRKYRDVKSRESERTSECTPLVWRERAMTIIYQLENLLTII